MQRIALLFLFILGCVALMHAQSSNTKTLNGTVCDSSCVVQENGLATCDKSCTIKSGEAVLVDDQGKLMRVANQDVCKSHIGKHVKATVKPTDRPAAAAAPTEKQREQELQGQEQYFQVLQMEELGG